MDRIAIITTALADSGLRKCDVSGLRKWEGPQEVGGASGSDRRGLGEVGVASESGRGLRMCDGRGLREWEWPQKVGGASGCVM